jgi:hypothetical protein
MQTDLKSRLRLVLWSAALIIVCGLSQSHADPLSPATNVVRFDARELLKENSSLESVLFQLAAERFTANQKRHKTWIMTLHDGSTTFDVIKYTDGKTTVIALPVLDPNDEYGLRRYVDHYNRLNIKAADLEVKAGEYREAHQLYRLLLHHDPRSSLAEGIRLRLQYLERIEAGHDVQTNLSEFVKLYTDIAPGFLLGVEDTKPVLVTNLFQVKAQER